MKLIIEEKDVGLEIDLNEVRAAIRPVQTFAESMQPLQELYNETMKNFEVRKFTHPFAESMNNVEVGKFTHLKKPGRKPGRKPKVVNDETFPAPIENGGEQ